MWLITLTKQSIKIVLSAWPPWHPKPSIHPLKDPSTSETWQTLLTVTEWQLFSGKLNDRGVESIGQKLRLQVRSSWELTKPQISQNVFPIPMLTPENTLLPWWVATFPPKVPRQIVLLFPIPTPTICLGSFSIHAIHHTGYSFCFVFRAEAKGWKTEGTQFQKSQVN